MPTCDHFGCDNPGVHKRVTGVAFHYACDDHRYEVCDHEPDWTNASVSVEYGWAYVDVPCKHCGFSGCAQAINLETATVDWD